ncbi:MAG: hypothetical protein IJY66_01030, partial [Clostridia bacterium]|nr:hypothetical protein [Clostridia bacterium]
SEGDGEGGEGADQAGAPAEQSTDPEGKAAPQSEGERAINAIKRRESERREELQRVREQTIIETLGGINPYTGEEMKDSEDVKQYLTMREIKARGGDPVGDYAKYHTIMERERAQKAAEEEQKRTDEAERRAAHERDVSAFREKYPDVSMQSMMNDAEFMAYAKGRVGKDGSIYAVYDAYAAAKAAEDARVEQRAREMAAQMQANAKASPGTAKGEASTQVTRYTPEMVRAMSKEEIKANYDKICRDIKYWK